MNAGDEKVRDAVTDALTRPKVDARSLAVEVSNGHVMVRGTVPSAEQEAQLATVLREQLGGQASLDCAVSVREVAASDQSDGRGRSPLTGTSADSAHESRHQLDRS
jgi:hypothetical protein